MKFMPFFFDPQLKNHLSLAQMSWFLSNNAKTGVLLLSWIQDGCQSPCSPFFCFFLSVNGWLSEIEDECRSSCSSSGVTAPQATPGSLTTSYLVVSTRLLFHLLLIILSYFFAQYLVFILLLTLVLSDPLTKVSFPKLRSHLVLWLYHTSLEHYLV